MVIQLDALPNYWDKLEPLEATAHKIVASDSKQEYDGGVNGICREILFFLACGLHQKRFGRNSTHGTPTRDDFSNYLDDFLVAKLTDECNSNRLIKARKILDQAATGVRKPFLAREEAVACVEFTSATVNLIQTIAKELSDQNV